MASLFLTFSTSPSLSSTVWPIDISSCPACLTPQVAAQPPAQSAPMLGQPIAHALLLQLTCGARAHMLCLASRRPIRIGSMPPRPFPSFSPQKMAPARPHFIHNVATTCRLARPRSHLHQSNKEHPPCLSLSTISPNFPSLSCPKTTSYVATPP